MRPSIYFLAFLTLATLSAGILYQAAISLWNGDGGLVNAFVFGVSATTFVFASLVLWRIIYWTVPRKQGREEVQP